MTRRGAELEHGTWRRVQHLLESVQIHSETQFSFGQEGKIDLDVLQFRAPQASSSLENLVCALQGHLYNRAYMRDARVSAPKRNHGLLPRGNPLSRLIRERSGSMLDSGWSLEGNDAGGMVVATKGLWRRRVPGHQVFPTLNGHSTIQAPVPYLDPDGTFVFLSGRTLADGVEEGDLFRIYLHTNALQCAEPLEALLRLLDEYALPFVLKTLVEPEKSDRCDATVLYLRRQYCSSALSCLDELREVFDRTLSPTTPLFALPLAPGVALAEDPPRGESFGMSRMRMVAEALVLAWQRGIEDVDGKEECLRRRFQQEGVLWDQPHLGPGSRTQYRRLSGGEPSSPRSWTQSENRSPYLETANRIGAALCRDALWAGELCTWQGWSVVERGDHLPVAWRTFGGDLYRGTSGICLFLAHLFRKTGQSLVRRTIQAGMRQALAQARRIKASERLGFYTGVVGIAYAAVEVGRALDEPGWVEQGLELLAGFAERPEAQLFDAVSGVSGGIPTLIDWGTRFRREELCELALEWGRALLASARKEEGCWSWAESDERPALCGYSHGASGVAVALAELYGLTGEAQWKAGAQAALRFERRHFQQLSGNWTDRRLPPSQQVPARSMAWCHGAPGIGLARLRLAELLPGDEQVLADREVAWKTTAASLSVPSEPSLDNYSLCHGALGNADALLEAARRMRRPEWRAIADRAGQLALAEFQLNGGVWRSGLPEARPTPGLMLGDAGVGYFFLRLHESHQVPSVLLVGPRA